MLETMFPLFYENLQDNIPSVRQGAALAIANICTAYGKLTPKLLDYGKSAPCISKKVVPAW